MATIHKNHRNGNPSLGRGWNICPACHRKNCRCFMVGSSMTYQRVIRDVHRVFGNNLVVGGSRPTEIWQSIVQFLEDQHSKNLL